MNENELYIYGAIIHDSDPMAEEWGYVTLAGVNKTLDAIPNDSEKKTILVRINSEGGDVDTGFAIYSALRRKASEGFTIKTRMDGIAASIATVVFLAGDARIGNEYIDPFIHNAWTWGQGDAEDFEKVAEKLQRTNERIAKFYAEHTSLTEEKALEMMQNDTSIDASEIVSLGFATELEELLRPAALKKVYNKYSLSNSKKGSTMSTENEEKTNKLLSGIETILNKFLPDNKKTINNENGEELVFMNLGENDVLEKGAAATLEDKPAEGEHILPSMNKIVTFEKGKVTEIKDMEEDSSTSEEDVETLQNRVQTLTEENETLKAQNEQLEKNQKDFRKELDGLKALASGFEYTKPPSSQSDNSDPSKTKDQPQARRMFKKETYEK
jgi:ATP-dependent protease ClpP protease subunit/regulator of replication initiation timing